MHARIPLASLNFFKPLIPAKKLPAEYDTPSPIFHWKKQVSIWVIFLSPVELRHPIQIQQIFKINISHIAFLIYCKQHPHLATVNGLLSNICLHVFNNIINPRFGAAL